MYEAIETSGKAWDSKSLCHFVAPAPFYINEISNDMREQIPKQEDCESFGLYL